MSNRAASATGAAWAPPLVTPSFAPCVAASVSPPNVSEIKLVFSIPPERPIPNIPPSWNVARPTRSRSSVTMRGRASGAQVFCAGVLRRRAMTKAAYGIDVGLPFDLPRRGSLDDRALAHQIAFWSGIHLGIAHSAFGARNRPTASQAGLALAT